IGLLASLGVPDVLVHRLPRVAVMTTGDEIVDPDTTPTGPIIRDANTPSGVAALREWGYEAIRLGIAPDDARAQEAMIR
ncbi:MAG: molybdopterin molybdenumtransferase MoeA, partial [Dehalococcoidia bacterium]|nr:molybdopterin molybdenumtransferase MoeA [Dehalococcoidia bacterium]